MESKSLTFEASTFFKKNTSVVNIYQNGHLKLKNLKTLKFRIFTNIS